MKQTWANSLKNSRSRKYSRPGFTIVELLIVIVIIAILAAISIVAYSGIQQRAENTMTIAAVNSYKKMLTQYKTLEGKDITTGGICLGDQYPPLGTQTAGGCRHSSSPLPNMSATYKTELQKVANNMPMPSTKKYVNSSGTEYVGTWFYGVAYNYKLDGQAVGWIMYVFGGTTCPDQSYVLVTDATNGGYNASPSPETANRYYAINPDASLCLVPVV